MLPGCVFMAFFLNPWAWDEMAEMTICLAVAQRRGVSRTCRCRDKDEKTSGLTRSLLLAGCDTRESGSWQRFLKWLEEGRREGLLWITHPYAFEKRRRVLGRGLDERSCQMWRDAQLVEKIQRLNLIFQEKACGGNPVQNVHVPLLNVGHNNKSF